MKLILLRHGLTAANEQHLYCGATDIGLSESGKAALLRRKKAVTYPDFSGKRVITSGLLRCEETLFLLVGDVAHETDAAFREMDFGIFEMRSYENMKNDPAYLAWIEGDNESNVAPGGESGVQMRRRVLDGLGRLLADNRDTLLVTHGGVIAVIMAHLFPAEQKNRFDWQPLPAGGYAVNLTNGRYAGF